MSEVRSEPVPTSENGKGRKPNGSAWKQQELKAFHPVFTAGNVGPLFLLLGVLFVPIGIALFVISNDVKELEIDFTDCKQVLNGVETDSTCYYEMFIGNSTSCKCEVKADNIGTGWTKDVMLYYGLTNFFQNHRSYVKSRDDNQLLGDITSQPKSDCSPFLDPPNDPGKIYIPCGAIANSMFSDKIELMYSNSSKDWRTVGLIRTGIAWDADKKYKFKNPSLGDKPNLAAVFKASNYSRPKNWRLDIWQLDEENPDNNGLQNEDLMVWMRTAALPNFRKLYRRVNHSGDFQEGLPDGSYKFVIDYRYDVKSFGGTKSVILANASALGGKNSFLGVAYMVVGCICFFLAGVFLFVHFKFGKTIVSETML